MIFNLVNVFFPCWHYTLEAKVRIQKNENSYMALDKYRKVKVKSLSRVRLLAAPWTTAQQALRPWDFPGKNTGVGCHCLLC